MEQTPIPIYRAKIKNSDEYVIGLLSNYIGQDGEIWDDMGLIIQHKVVESDDYYWWDTSKIDPSTLSVHFPAMLAKNSDRYFPNGEKDLRIFAALNKSGLGGDLVISKSYPFYGDAPEIKNSSGKCEKLNYQGLLSVSENGYIYLDYIRVSERVSGNVVGGLIDDFEKFEIIGIKQ